ncbi:MAG: GIY-YIG nuclease family protein [Desulfobacterales bacterium]|nr:GIY-YIG nuclease family protein [Desulfobacterales bacterium]
MVFLPANKLPPSSWHVYLLRCRDGSLYTGYTNDLDNRLAAHNAGKGAKYTASRRPVQLAYTEPVDSKSAAMQRELQIKHWTKAKKEALIAGSHKRLKNLSKRNPVS